MDKIGALGDQTRTPICKNIQEGQVLFFMTDNRDTDKYYIIVNENDIKMSHSNLETQSEFLAHLLCMHLNFSAKNERQ